MKVYITFKDPDGVFDCIAESTEEAINSRTMPNLDDDELEAAQDARTERIKAGIKQWVKYDEYLTVEFDLEAGVATVVPAN